MSVTGFEHIGDVNGMIEKYRSRFFSLKSSRKHSMKTSQKSSIKVSLKTSLNNPIKADILVASNFDDET